MKQLNQEQMNEVSGGAAGLLETTLGAIGSILDGLTTVLLGGLVKR